MGSSRLITGLERVADDVVVGDEGADLLGEEGGDLNSHRPRRRKQDVQVAMPGMGEVGSAPQPRRARVRARGLIVGVEEEDVGRGSSVGAAVVEAGDAG